ncbi:MULTISPECIES: CAP domain-containing protein, partial [Pasteurellaceae]|uniref:CAP domain-containing protein n=1 Tax=Pasteurellaceae TaxID=712 RepID=UPI001B83D950
MKKTNEYRQAVGKPPLEWDEKLAAYAQMRSQELVKQYGHTRPNGTDSSSEIIITYGAVGENIAVGQDNAEDVSLGWKNSPGHYRSMISGNFSRIGIGLVRVPKASDPQGYTYYWTQTFGGGNAESPYTFDENRKPKEPDVINILGNNIVLLEENKLDIQGGEEVA